MIILASLIACAATPMATITNTARSALERRDFCCNLRLRCVDRVRKEAGNG